MKESLCKTCKLAYFAQDMQPGGKLGRITRICLVLKMDLVPFLGTDGQVAEKIRFDCSSYKPVEKIKVEEPKRKRGRPPKK